VKKVGEIESIKNEAEAVRDRLNRQQKEIEALFQKARESGEELPPDLVAEFEKEKQNIAEINKKVDNISAVVKKKRPANNNPIKKRLLMILYICAYLGGLILSFGLISIGGRDTEKYVWFSTAGFILLVVTSIVFIIWIIRGIIRWIARTAKEA
jgi:ABC-type multidrug transport system fused ATPase/permease subunit